MINFILSLHIFSTLNVVSSLIFNNWINIYIAINNLLKLEDTSNINQEKIFKMWLLSIQCRYIISDLLYFYKVKNRYIFNHFLESVICTIIFYQSKNFMFSYICFIWTIFWKLGLLYNKKIFLK